MSDKYVYGRMIFVCLRNIKGKELLCISSSAVFSVKYAVSENRKLLVCKGGSEFLMLCFEEDECPCKY